VHTRDSCNNDNSITKIVIVLLLIGACCFVDPIVVSAEDKEKLQSVEILLAYPTLLSLFNFQFANLRWLQCLSAGMKRL